MPPDTNPAGRLPAFTFYNYFRSSAAYRVRIALNLKGVVLARIVDLDIRHGEQRTAEGMAGLTPLKGASPRTLQWKWGE